MRASDGDRASAGEQPRPRAFNLSIPARLALIGPVAGAVVAVAFVTIVGVVLLVLSTIQVGQLFAGYVLEFIIAVIVAFVAGVIGGAICSMLAGVLLALASLRSPSRWLRAWLAAAGGLAGGALSSLLSHLVLGAISPLWLSLVFAPLAAAGYFFLVFIQRPARPVAEQAPSFLL